MSTILLLESQFEPLFIQENPKKFQAAAQVKRWKFVACVKAIKPDYILGLNVTFSYQAPPFYGQCFEFDFQNESKI